MADTYGLSFDDIKAASDRIHPIIRKTECTPSISLSEEHKLTIYFKQENRQYTGSFKPRGAANAILKLPEEQRRQGIVTAGPTNHSVAVEYVGWKLNSPVTTVLPTNASPSQIEACKQYGADVVLHGNTHMDAKNYARELAKSRNCIDMSGYDNIDAIAGQGTIALEIMEQIPDVDACLVPLGSGCLAAGVGAGLKTLNPKVQVIAVELEGANGFSEALKGCRVSCDSTQHSIAIGLSQAQPANNALEIGRKVIDKIVRVSEESVSKAMLKMWVEEKTVVEGAGAVGVAAVIEGLLPELENKKVVVLLTGGNIESPHLSRRIRESG